MYSDNTVSVFLSRFKKDPAQMVILDSVDVNVVYLDAYKCLGIYSNRVLARRKVGECENTFLIRENAPLRCLFALKQQFDSNL